MNTIDIIDTIAASVYDIDPAMLYSKSRPERLAYARFVAISLRYNDGMTAAEIAQRYDLNVETIRYGICRTRELVKYNAPFRAKYEYALNLYTTKSIPFSAAMLTPGCRVRTRTDSTGMSLCGIVTHVGASSFTVESFTNPDYKTEHDLNTGRVWVEYESSRDIVSITI